jgi:RNA polymerase sigma factor (sigma-70 family)
MAKKTTKGTVTTIVLDDRKKSSKKKNDHVIDVKGNDAEEDGEEFFVPATQVNISEPDLINTLPVLKKSTDLKVQDPLQLYMKEISRHKLLTIEEERELTAELLRTGDIDVAKKLVLANLRLVVKIAFEYRNASKNIMDLIQEGNIGLMKAVSKYDPSKGAKLSYYASWWIRSYILKFILDNFRLVKIGTTQEQKKLFYNLMREKQRLMSMGIADKHAGVMAMSRQNINPYKVGIELMRDIEYRWDRGMFGKEYNECNSMPEKLRWDTKLGLGKQKIFEVRKSHNDISFIDEFLTPDFCERQQLFTYKYNPRTGRFEIDSKDFQAIKQKLLSQLTNFGQPIIEVEDGNYMNRKELLLNHIHYGVDLDVNYVSETLKNLFAIWRRPVNLKTKYEDKEVIFHFDGKEFKPQH